MAVARRSTIHGAASEIGITQTGVTQRIRALERRLGTTLFTRSRRGMRLTQEGEALQRYCERAADLEGELLSFLSGEATARAVRIHVTGPSSIMRSRVIPAATGCLKEHPSVSFTFNMDDGKSGLAYLKSGESQLAVLERHEVADELDSKLLKPARYVLVVPPAWRNRRTRDIVSNERIVDFNDEDDATYRYLEKHGLLDVCRRERHLANNIDALASLVAGGVGYSVLSTDFAKPLIEGGSLACLNEKRHLTVEFALAWYPRHQMPAYFRALVKAIS